MKSSQDFINKASSERVNSVLSFEELLKFFERNKNRRFLLTFHTIGDRDGVAASLGLSSIIKDSIVATPDYITNNAKHMLEKSGIDKEIGTVFPENIDIVVVLDANRLELLGRFRKKLKQFNGEILFIDHHSPPEHLPEGALLFNNEDYNSASSIVYEIIKAFDAKTDKSHAYALINGIVADSADFQNSNAQTFMQISELLESAGMSYSEVVDNVHGPESSRIRNMILKDMFLAEVSQYRDYLLVAGEAKFQANTAAETSLRIGADAAVFWSIRKGEASLSARLRSPLDKTVGLNLGILMEEAGRILHGTGGGHPCAAGAFGKRKEGIAEARQYVINRIREGFLSERKK